MTVLYPPKNNAPELWLSCFPFPRPEQHKYDRGHAVILGGGIETAGAARLAARAALRIGAGLVTVACDSASLPVYAASLTAVMTRIVETTEDWRMFLKDTHKNAVLIGPGAGITSGTQDKVLETLRSHKRTVLDADALTVFQNAPQTLFKAIHSETILLPHEGEFSRIFNIQGDKHHKALEAAKQSGAMIVLKGHHTVIAAPDGRSVTNTNAPPWLATAGSGDVLAGIVLGLLAQGMPTFEAACAAVWLHGDAASRFGIGLIAEDLSEMLPQSLSAIAPLF